MQPKFWAQLTHDTGAHWTPRAAAAPYIADIRLKLPLGDAIGYWLNFKPPGMDRQELISQIEAEGLRRKLLGLNWPAKDGYKLIQLPEAP